MVGIWPIYLYPLPIWLNLSVVLLGLAILVIAIIEKFRANQKVLFEVSALLLLIGFTFLTFHGVALQYFLPIVCCPEQPLIDNNLTFNYTLANLLIYLVFPILLLILMRSEISLEKLGFRVKNFRMTFIYVILGVIISAGLYLITFYFFPYNWITGYTLDGLVLWVLLVSFLSVFLQTFFYIGLLFNKYLDSKYRFILAIVSILAAQFYINTNFWPWIVSNIVSSAIMIAVTWKTRNIYGAVSIGITSSLIDIFIQIL